MSAAKPWSRVDILRTDCRWFRGDVPCLPHKEAGVHCVDAQGSSCPRYERQASQILIIKLGALGDVIRSTPLLRRLRADYPEARIWWLTLTPEIVAPVVDVSLPFTPQALAVLQAVSFDILYNLDKDREACALAAMLSATVKKGFTLAQGKPAPIDQDAGHKYLTGLFDDLGRENTKSYPEEIFELCGFTFAGEKYLLRDTTDNAGKLRLPKSKRVVGLNTGCGGRWVSRLWPESSWIALSKKLKRSGFAVLLLGGEQEHQKNRRIASKSGALYPGHFPLPQFISLVNRCDLVVTGVTMAMHIAIGLDKKIVLFNNIFNKHEFELYGLGDILEPEGGCSCFYAPVCTDPRHAPHGCMRNLSVDAVFRSVTRLLPKP
jgi:lipopolysaccharide heptosyltransferase III